MNMQIKLPTEYELKACKEQGFIYVDGVFTRINPLSTEKQVIEINTKEEAKLLKEMNYWLIFYSLVITSFFILV